MEVEYFLLKFIYFLIGAYVREIKRLSLKSKKVDIKKLFVKFKEKDFMMKFSSS